MTPDEFWLRVAGLAVCAAVLAETTGQPVTWPAWTVAAATVGAWLLVALRAVALERRSTPRRYTP